jgi:hypothetical protein
MSVIERKKIIIITANDVIAFGANAREAPTLVRVCVEQVGLSEG